ncbi:mitochondrial fission protein [Aureococcus anophagefferens]|uniref:Mitochondrial fission protein n=1 Tax=Aureococcus anophagefferens TaxID=44056 RepID=A0ABR1FZB9_AURAN
MGVIDAAVVDTLGQLQALALTLGSAALELPQIVVLGSQSSGKSSAIEALVGLSFLPRGSGIVTRCPLLLHLRPREAGDGRGDYAVFGHRTDVFHDFDAVRREIEDRTAAVAGPGKGICGTPIVLRVHASGAPALTLVDLPGVTKVPVRGQPDDIGDTIRALCQAFAANPRSILLCVSAATQDLANSDALLLAREADPSGARTIGVLTKVDAMEDGTDCAPTLRNELLPLKLGYVAIVCRGQRDLDRGLSLSESRAKERAFFAATPAYADVPAACGVPRLAAKLSALLVAATVDAVPALRRECGRHLDIAEAEVARLGGDEPDGGGDAGRDCLEAVLGYAQAYVALVRDGAADDALGAPGSAGSGAARVAFVFERVFSASLEKVDALDGVSDDDVRDALAATRGAAPALFAPEKAFYYVVRQQIGRLREPGLAPRSSTPSLASSAPRAPLRRVEDLVDMELAHVNTRHPDFRSALGDFTVSIGALVGGGGGFSDDEDEEEVEAPPPAAEKTPDAPRGWFGALTDATPPKPAPRRDRRESFVLRDAPRRGGAPKPRRPKKLDASSEVDAVKALVRAYFSVVRKTFCDLVPKIVMTHVVGKVEATLQTTLMADVYAGGDHAALLAEDGDAAAARARALQERATLRGALALLDAVERAPKTPKRTEDSLDGLDDAPSPALREDRRNTITERRRNRSPMKAASPAPRFATSPTPRFKENARKY